MTKSQWPIPPPEERRYVRHKRTGNQLIVLDRTRSGKLFVVEEGDDVDDAFIVYPGEVTEA